MMKTASMIILALTLGTTNANAKPSARAAIQATLQRQNPLASLRGDTVRTTRKFPGGTRHAVLTRAGGSKYLFSISPRGVARQLKTPPKSRRAKAVSTASTQSGALFDSVMGSLRPNSLSDQQIRTNQRDFMFNTMLRTHKLREMDVSIPWNL